MLFAELNKLIAYQALNVVFVKTTEVNAVPISQPLVTTKKSFADQDTMLMTTWAKLALDVEMMMNLNVAFHSSTLAETKTSNVMLTNYQETHPLSVMTAPMTLKLVVLMLLILAPTKTLFADQVTTKQTTLILFAQKQDV
jgi:hypothetical protein